MWKRACMFFVPRKYSRFSSGTLTKRINVFPGIDLGSRNAKYLRGLDHTFRSYHERYEYANGETRQLLDNWRNISVSADIESKRFILYSSFGQFGRFVFNAIDSNLGQLGNFNLNIFRRAIFFLFFLISHREILDIVLNNSKCGFRKIISRIFIHIYVRSYRDISRAAIGQFATNGHIARWNGYTREFRNFSFSRLNKRRANCPQTKHVFVRDARSRVINGRAGVGWNCEKVWIKETAIVVAHSEILYVRTCTRTHDENASADDGALRI